MNFGNFSDMFVIVVLALIIFGPKRLPEMARQLGKALSEFKRASNDFKAQLEAEMRQIEIEETLRKEKESLSQAIAAPAGTFESTASAPESMTPYAAEPAQLPAGESAPYSGETVHPPSETDAKTASSEASEGSHA